MTPHRTLTRRPLTSNTHSLTHPRKIPPKKKVNGPIISRPKTVKRKGRDCESKDWSVSNGHPKKKIPVFSPICTWYISNHSILHRLVAWGDQKLSKNANTSRKPLAEIEKKNETRYIWKSTATSPSPPPLPIHSLAIHSSTSPIGLICLPAVTEFFFIL